MEDAAALGTAALLSDLLKTSSLSMIEGFAWCRVSYAIGADDAEYFWRHLEGRARDPWVARECWCVSAVLVGEACKEHSPACG